VDKQSPRDLGRPSRKSKKSIKIRSPQTTRRSIATSAPTAMEISCAFLRTPRRKLLWCDLIFPVQRKPNGLCLADYTWTADQEQSQRKHDTVAFLWCPSGRAYASSPRISRTRRLSQCHIIQALAARIGRSLRRNASLADPKRLGYATRLR